MMVAFLGRLLKNGFDACRRATIKDETQRARSIQYEPFLDSIAAHRRIRSEFFSSLLVMIHRDAWLVDIDALGARRTEETVQLRTLNNCSAICREVLGVPAAYPPQKMK